MYGRAGLIDRASSTLCPTPFWRQSLFIYLLGTTDLTEPEYDQDDVYDYRQWRRSEAHSVQYYDRLTDRSLASRVCDGSSGLSVSATISNDFEDVSQYLEDDGYKGTFMCTREAAPPSPTRGRWQGAAA